MIKGLLRKVLKKDRDSERIIFEMFYERVYFTAYYIVQDRDLAQDVVQETFVKVFKNIHTVESGEKLGAWIAAIASRTAIDQLRKIKRWNDIATEDVIINEQLAMDNEYVSSVETIVEERVLKSILYQTMDEIKPEHKQVLILRYLHDMSYEEIARSLQINITTVRSRIHRAKLQLRRSIENQPALREMIFNAKI
ncbi:RNA polymerase sigma factor [Bacillus sp. FSL K6-3431]|uniref:RNA polymerase sigma factor n=1 Tax=Bacillus sp. FSL K6-3431 TaxID=2921500 RepID=UPI0030F6A9F2